MCSGLLEPGPRDMAGDLPISSEGGLRSAGASEPVEASVWSAPAPAAPATEPSKPASSIAPSKAGKAAVPSTVAFPPARSTATLVTPATARSPLSARATQCSHVMPLTLSSTGTARRAPKPVSSTAATKAASAAVPSTTAELLARSTATEVTPGTALSAASTLPVQWLHIMPDTASVTGTASRAPKPVSSTAATSASGATAPSTTAELLARSTATEVTPGTALSAASTLPVQWLHIMPDTASVVDMTEDRRGSVHPRQLLLPPTRASASRGPTKFELLLELSTRQSPETRRQDLASW